MAKTHEGGEVIKCLLNDFNLIYSNQNFRLTIITLSLYSEYIVNQLVKKHFKHGLDDDKNATHSIKLKFLSGVKIIEKGEYEVLDGLRKARNELAHKIPIEIKEETLNKIAAEIEPNYGDETIRREFKDKPKLARFIWAAMAKVFWLIAKFYNEEDLILVIRNQKFVLEKINSSK